MIELVVALGVLILCMFAAASVHSYVKYIKLRFRLFALRDQILHLALEGHITKEHAVSIYNSLNWPLRHLLVFPVVFCFRSLARTMDELEEMRGRFEELPVELQEWYIALGKTTLSIVRAYTPFGHIFAPRKTGAWIVNWLFTWPVLLVFLIYLKAITLNGNSLGRKALGKINIETTKEERDAIVRTEKSAQRISGMSSAPG